MVLGDLELLLLHRLRELGPITPARLLERLEGQWTGTYSTLANTLRRLEKKGLVEGLGPQLKGHSRQYCVNQSNPVYRQTVAIFCRQLLNAFGDVSNIDCCNQQQINQIRELSRGRNEPEMTEEEIDILIGYLHEMKLRRKGLAAG